MVQRVNSPLTALIIDLKVKHMTKDQIRKNYQAGKYKGALRTLNAKATYS